MHLIPPQIAPPEVRGMLGSLNQLTICIGILGALLVNVVLPPTAWRTMFWLATLPAAMLAFGGCQSFRATGIELKPSCWICFTGAQHL